MHAPATSRRIETIDLARGAALVAMAIYHFAWDLEFFGYAPAGMTAEGGWRLFARAIASSFLFLVGVSLVLAHGREIRWRPFLVRFAMVAGAAAAITVATWFAVPDAFIFFGILHHIAVASLLGLAFLRLPWWATLGVAAAALVAPFFLRSAIFDHPALWWIGLSSVNPRSNDYVPLLPFFAAVLAGIAATRLAQATGALERLKALPVPGWTWPIRFAGRHSLAVYLVHQPVLIALVWLFAQVFPPTEVPREIRFANECRAQCEQSRDAEFCSLYCVCVMDDLVGEGRFDEVFEGRQGAETAARLQDIVVQCSFETEFSVPREE